MEKNERPDILIQNVFKLCVYVKKMISPCQRGSSLRIFSMSAVLATTPDWPSPDEPSVNPVVDWASNTWTSLIRTKVNRYHIHNLLYHNWQMVRFKILYCLKIIKKSLSKKIGYKGFQFQINAVLLKLKDN